MRTPGACSDRYRCGVVARVVRCGSNSVAQDHPTESDAATPAHPGRLGGPPDLGRADSYRAERLIGRALPRPLARPMKAARSLDARAARNLASHCRGPSQVPQLFRVRSLWLMPLLGDRPLARARLAAPRCFGTASNGKRTKHEHCRLDDLGGRNPDRARDRDPRVRFAPLAHRRHEARDERPSPQGRWLGDGRRRAAAALAGGTPVGIVIVAGVAGALALRALNHAK